MLRQRFVGVAPLGNAISFWIKGDIMVWSPDILPMLIIFCGCCFVIEDPRIKVGYDWGMAYLCDSYLVTAVQREVASAFCCRDLVRIRGVFPEAFLFR